MQKLIDRVINKERKAEQELYNIVEKETTGVLRKYVKCSETRKDVKQNILMRVFSNLHQYDSNRGSFYVWLFGITYNECFRSYHKKNKRNEYFTIDDENYGNIANPVEEKVSSITKDHIKSTFSKLTPGQRTVVQLHDIEGYEHLEVSQILNISVSTSKSQLCRGRKIIRQLLTY